MCRSKFARLAAHLKTSIQDGPKVRRQTATTHGQRCANYAFRSGNLCSKKHSNYATYFAILCFGYALNTAKLCFLMRLFLL